MKTDFSRQLHEFRKSAGLTQEQLAEKAGVSFQAVSKWETGKDDPSTTNLIELAKLYGTSPEELLKGN